MPLLLRMCRALSKRRKTCQTDRAVRLSVIRQRGENYLSPDEIPALLDDETPQQLLMSAFLNIESKKQPNPQKR